MFEAIRYGWRLALRRFGDVILMWLILLGLRIGFSIVLIPVVLALVGIAIALGGGVGLPVYLGLQFFLSPLAAVEAAVLTGGLVFVLVLVAPITFAGGLWETYHSSTWTLSWRVLTAPMAGAEALEGYVLPDGEEPAAGMPA